MPGIDAMLDPLEVNAQGGNKGELEMLGFPSLAIFIFLAGTSFHGPDLYQAEGARPLTGAVECHSPARSGHGSGPRGCPWSRPGSAGATSPTLART